MTLSGSRFVLSGFLLVGFLVGANRFPVGVVRFPVGFIRFPVGVIRFPVGVIRYPVGVIGYPVGFYQVSSWCQQNSSWCYHVFPVSVNRIPFCAIAFFQLVSIGIQLVFPVDVNTFS